jgi:hypothetical protein
MPTPDGKHQHDAIGVCPFCVAGKHDQCNADKGSHLPCKCAQQDHLPPLSKEEKDHARRMTDLLHPDLAVQTEDEQLAVLLQAALNLEGGGNT